MSGQIYLYFCVFLIALDALVGTVFWMFFSSMAFNPFYLVSFVLLDLIFILSNLHNIRFRELNSWLF